MQDRVHEAFSVISPFIAIKSLSAALAGTDVEYGNDFSAAGEGYRRNMIRILHDDLLRNSAGYSQSSAEWGYRANTRSGVRRVGKEWVRTRRSGWAPVNLKNK